jgi:hypothetical protein
MQRRKSWIVLAGNKIGAFSFNQSVGCYLLNPVDAWRVGMVVVATQNSGTD